jgi:hypothetical protein
VKNALFWEPFKESMHSMLEAKLQNCPLTSLNKYVYNEKSEIKRYMYIHTHAHTHTLYLCGSADAESYTYKKTK